MKSKTFVVMLALGVLAALVVADGSALGKAKKKKAGPVVVGKDDAGDWGASVDPTIAPAGDALAQELLEASIGLGEKGTINFIIKLNSLPPTGGIPEFTRYSWDITVDGTAYGISGGFTEYIRGVCNPLFTNYCPPPRDPGSTPFFVREGPCTVGAGGLGECHVRALVSATFDTATATITVPVPMGAIKAKPGSKIAPASNASFGATIYSAPQLFISSPNAPYDAMTVTKTFVVPKK